MLTELRQRGFRESPEDDIICRMRLPTRLNALIGRDLIVDFMPDDETILNFNNRWYRDALQTAADHALPSGTLIRVVTPSYFLDSLQAELAQAKPALRHYIAQAITALLAHRDFAYAVQSAARQQQAREELIFQRLEAITTPPAAQ